MARRRYGEVTSGNGKSHQGRRITMAQPVLELLVPGKIDFETFDMIPSVNGIPKRCFHRETSPLLLKEFASFLLFGSPDTVLLTAELPQAPNYKFSGKPRVIEGFFSMPMFYICVGEICSFVIKRTCFALFEQKTIYLMVVDILRG